MALDKLEVMRGFCRIVETGSFKNAADVLNVASTTLSGQIQNLENQLGVRLFHRTTRKVSPTADGLAYYQRILPLLDEIDDIHQELQQGEDLAGTLRVEVPSPMADSLIVPNLPSFVAKYPNLHIEIGSSERVVDLIREGVDCALRGGVIADEALVSKLIGKMPFCLCATPDFLTKYREIKTPADLTALPYLAFKFAATGKLAQMRLKTGELVLTHKPLMIFNNAQTYYLALRAGLGLGFIPRVIAQPFFETGELVEMLPDYPLQAMPLSFVYPYSRYTPKRIQVFKEWVEGLIAEKLIWQREAI